MRVYKLFLLLSALLAISGCANLDNMLSCTIAGDKAVVSSMYGRIGVSSVIRTADLPAECKLLKKLGEQNAN